MTATMVPQDQQGLGLTPTSRQDVISALLDDYAMGRSEASPFEISPVPALKELPPPPPVEREGNWSYEKPLPQLRQMSMRFQLRVDEPVSPDSPDGSRSSMESPPTRIVSRSMSRGSKPPSLRLLASNGSTATLPPTPALPSSTRTPVTASRLPQEEEKSLPPPPPAKSERRQSLKDRPAPERPTRYDSLVDREERNDRPATAGAVKRKPVPKFTSLAELGNGPRGGKGGPLPQPRPRKQSIEKEQEAFNEDRPATAVEARIVDIPERPSKSSINSQNRDVSPPRPAPPMISQLPPTPDEKVSPLPPPKKPFAGMGLPSNPRAKGQETPKHIRGKSSTGFDLMMKNATSAPQPNSIITPGPTPSPGTTEQIKQERSPISHVENAEQRRPFSFESIPPAPPQKAAEMPGPASARPASPVSPIEIATNSEAFPPRSTSRAPATFANLPSQQRAATPEERSTTPDDELSPPTPTTPVFTPLTVKPEPSDAPAITPKHLKCYSHHSTFVWSKNDFQPMACMICHSNDRERKWACVWCYLRICVGCSEELMKTPGRDLSKVVESRGAQPALEKVDSRHDSGTAANPSVVVWGAEDEYGGRGYGRENEDDFS